MSDGNRPARGLVGRRSATALGVALGIAGASLALWRAIPAPPIEDPEGRAPSFSLLALGDTGKRHRWLASLTEGQLAVAQGLASEDRRQPVDALVLLGDLFYMRGLESHELLPRVRMNLVEPYCRFLDLSGPRSAEVADACDVPPDERNPVPLFAVLGNHDVISEESPRLQREVVPQLVASFRLDDEVARVHELAGGVSLILLDSESPTTRTDPAPLARALAASRGPWRIVAAHRPAAIDDAGGVPPRGSYHDHITEATRRSGVVIHAFLAGHHHSLQLIELDAPAPILNAVVGSGSRHRPIELAHPQRRYGASSLGFARVDVVEDDGSERLVVSLFATPRYPVLTRSAPRLVARWSVTRDGVARDELAPDRAGTS